MNQNLFQITTQVWLYPGKAAWHFVSIDENISGEITFLFGHMKHGWGSLPVIVTLGSTTWETSIFPDKKSGIYLLPLKSEIRKKENIHAGDTINFSVEIIS